MLVRLLLATLAARLISPGVVFGVGIAGAERHLGPLFSVIVFGGGSTTGEGRSLASSGPPKDSASHQVMLYICFAHAFVNPKLFLLLHNGLKEARTKMITCGKLPTSFR